MADSPYSALLSIINIIPLSSFITLTLEVNLIGHQWTVGIFTVHHKAAVGQEQQTVIIGLSCVLASFFKPQTTYMQSVLHSASLTATSFTSTRLVRPSFLCTDHLLHLFLLKPSTNAVCIWDFMSLFYIVEFYVNMYLKGFIHNQCYILLFTELPKQISPYWSERDVPNSDLKSLTYCGNLSCASQSCCWTGAADCHYCPQLCICILLKTSNRLHASVW